MNGLSKPTGNVGQQENHNLWNEGSQFVPAFQKTILNFIDIIQDKYNRKALAFLFFEARPLNRRTFIICETWLIE